MLFEEPNCSIFSFSDLEILPNSNNPSTKKRIPFSVGTLPADVCGENNKPSFCRLDNTAVLSNLQKEGLLFSPHTSAGRVPTEKGMRFFVDGLLEFGRISKSEKENIEQLGSSKSKSYQQVLDEASSSTCW